MTNSKEIRTLNHCAFSLTIHLVLVTKYRSRCLNGAMLVRLQATAAELAVKWKCELLEFNGEPDHVHLLLSLSPTVAPASFTNNLKTLTSMMLRREFKVALKRHFWRFNGVWSRSYCVLSSGGAPLEVLKRYIERQDRPL